MQEVRPGPEAMLHPEQRVALEEFMECRMEYDVLEYSEDCEKAVLAQSLVSCFRHRATT
jgi:hypothetical protein